MDKTSYSDTEKLIKQQDVMLGEIEKSLEKLKTSSVNINIELKGQNKMLDKLDNDIESGNNKMENINQKLMRLLKSQNPWSMFLIFALFLVLIVLIILIIFL